MPTIRRTEGAPAPGKTDEPADFPTKCLSKPSDRPQALGRLFYAPNLISTLSVAQNICLPWRANGVPVDAEYVGLLIDTFNVRELMDLYPGDLSRRQQLQVASVRALAGRPAEVEIFPGLDPLAAEAAADLNLIATELGQPWRWADLPFPLRSGEGELPDSLDEIAPAPRLSGTQVELIDQAQRILSELPGPVEAAIDPFASNQPEIQPRGG